MYATLEEVQEQKAAHLIHELWSGRVSKHWARTVRTLRRHYINNVWDRQQAAKLIRHNLREARVHLADELIDTPVFDLAELTLLDTLERMYELSK